MAKRDVNIRFQNCKIDFENGMILEHLSDEILEHRISDVFKDYDVNQNEYFFDLTLRESTEIRPSDDE